MSFLFKLTFLRANALSVIVRVSRYKRVDKERTMKEYANIAHSRPSVLVLDAEVVAFEDGAEDWAEAAVVESPLCEVVM